MNTSRVDGVKAPQHRETPRTDLRAKPPLSRRRCCCCSASSPCPAPSRAWRRAAGRRTCRRASRRPCPLSFRRRRPSFRRRPAARARVIGSARNFRRACGGGGGVDVCRHPLRPLGPPARRAALQQRSTALAAFSSYSVRAVAPTRQQRGNCNARASVKITSGAGPCLSRTAGPKSVQSHRLPSVLHAASSHTRFSTPKNPPEAQGKRPGGARAESPGPSA